MNQRNCEIAVVIPCYRVARHLAAVLSDIGPEVTRVYCVIDGCTEGSEAVATAMRARDPRIQVLSADANRGVGYAFGFGCQQALKDGADVIVKLDGDGQMAPQEIMRLVQPLLAGKADYAKGNRFFFLEDLQAMPWIRMLGNAGLSFLSKLSSGYWNLFDTTNGFFAIRAAVAHEIPWTRVSRRFFFESDLLFQLAILRAVVVDVPMKARYGDERSNLSVWKALVQFPSLHLVNFCKRLFYCYFLREFNIASLYLVVSFVLIGFGTLFGLAHWFYGHQLNRLASAGTVMFAALPVILGWQALLSFLAYDVNNVPKVPFEERAGTCSRHHHTSKSA